MHLTSRIDYTFWKKLSIPMSGMCMLVLLVMVLVPSLGVAAKGARRWLRLGPISIQPAEMVEARDGDVSGGLSDQEGGQDHVLSERTLAGVDRDRIAQRIGVARTGSRDRRGDRAGDGRMCFSRRRADHSSAWPWHSVRFRSCIGARPWLQLSPPAAS